MKKEREKNSKKCGFFLLFAVNRGDRLPTMLGPVYPLARVAIDINISFFFDRSLIFMICAQSARSDFPLNARHLAISVAVCCAAD